MKILLKKGICVLATIIALIVFTIMLPLVATTGAVKEFFNIIVSNVRDLADDLKYEYKRREEKNE